MYQLILNLISGKQEVYHSDYNSLSTAHKQFEKYMYRPDIKSYIVKELSYDQYKEERY